MLLSAVCLLTLMLGHSNNIHLSLTRRLTFGSGTFGLQLPPLICSHWLELVKHCVTMETPSSTALHLSQLPARRCCRCLSSCCYLAVGAVIMRTSSRRRGLTLGSASVHHLLTTAATVANELAGHGVASVRVTCPSLSATCSTMSRRVASGWRATRVILQLKLVSVQDGESV